MLTGLCCLSVCLSAMSRHTTVAFYNIVTGYEVGCNEHTGKGLWTLWRTLKFLQGRDCFVSLNPLLVIDTECCTEIAAVCSVKQNDTALLRGSRYSTACRCSGETQHNGNSEVVTQFTDNLTNITSLCQLVSINPIHTNTKPEHYTLVYQHFCTTFRSVIRPSSGRG